MQWLAAAQDWRLSKSAKDKNASEYVKWIAANDLLRFVSECNSARSDLLDFREEYSEV